jgi:hypothetical protein
LLPFPLIKSLQVVHYVAIKRSGLPVSDQWPPGVQARLLFQSSLLQFILPACVIGYFACVCGTGGLGTAAAGKQVVT